MNRRMLSILLAAGLVASVFATAAPVRASHVEVPSDDVANIVDQSSDANYHSTGTGSDAGPSLVAADIVKVWFTHDADTISAHFQTAGAAQPPWSLLYRVFVDPGAGSNCLQFRGFTGAAGNPAGEATGSIRDTCDGDTVTEGEFVQEEGPPVLDDGRASGIHTITLPRDAHPSFADGSVLATPQAETRHFTVAVTAPVVDDTEVGTDYTITPEEKVEKKKKKSPPGKDDPPGKGKKKGCKKGKGKKKGACPGKKKPAPPVLACAPYEPGEEGAEAETTVVTDEATEEAPLEVEIDAPMGLPEQDNEFGDARVYHNVQVDSANSEAGLYVRYEFQERRDYDLFLNYASGSEAARAAGFNPAPEGPFDGTGNGGHSETNAEQVDGLRSPDCQGYTARLSTYLGEGGSLMLKLWLGEIQNDPAPDQRGMVAAVFGLF